MVAEQRDGGDVPDPLAAVVRARTVTDHVAEAHHAIDAQPPEHRLDLDQRLEVRVDVAQDGYAHGARAPRATEGKERKMVSVGLTAGQRPPASLPNRSISRSSKWVSWRNSA